ncbi:exodeoxyribonuclease VII large subunit [Campylobacter geochelonis]|uniref:exodeoxyribonuclease VII large subunit n=1 Tax=Campylobacter geochelonis TaxID=1780362 RepID=UPI00077086F5|nr:exodeoxyribonuclease VII large subunit [Campylobacter geochelonis]CZE46747.1 exodeoxyribonuclease VII large subunit [Campylobacter geochelonis]CZE50324.1 exodeoxyribonuclease VII large subunit [Campylobacter geochelonis]
MILTVSELNEQAKSLLETNFGSIEVSGEVSRFIENKSSKHWYFTLKDEKGAISCAMFSFNNKKIKFSIKDGMKVVASGKVSLYVPNGGYQLVASSLRIEGVGELELAFKQLKEKLEKEGLFKPEHKKPLPKFPTKIAIITSATSAAYQDMLRVAKDRCEFCQIYLYNSLMQGESAANSVIKALQKADKAGYDAIVIARGGGSKEDLWCFNDESLARAIFASQTPIISAVGHEIDFSISDFVSDHRSLTPTASMVDLLPDKMSLYQEIDSDYDRLNEMVYKKILACENWIKHLEIELKNKALGKKIEQSFKDIENLRFKIHSLFKAKFSKFQNELSLKEAVFAEKNQLFSAVKNYIQVQKDGKNISLKELKSGDLVELYSQDDKKQAVIK